MRIGIGLAMLLASALAGCGGSDGSELRPRPGETTTPDLVDATASEIGAAIDGQGAEAESDAMVESTRQDAGALPQEAAPQETLPDAMTVEVDAGSSQEAAPPTADAAPTAPDAIADVGTAEPDAASDSGSVTVDAYVDPYRRCIASEDPGPRDMTLTWVCTTDRQGWSAWCPVGDLPANCFETFTTHDPLCFGMQDFYACPKHM